MRAPVLFLVLLLVSVLVATFVALADILADMVYQLHYIIKSVITVGVFWVSWLPEGWARSRFLDEGKQAGDSTALTEPEEVGSALEQAADSKALLKYMVVTVLSAITVVFLLAVLWIPYAVAQLALYQLLASVAMLSSIVIGVVHLTHARKQLNEAERQRRGIAELSRVLGRLEDTMKGLDGKGVLSLQRNLKFLLWSTAGLAFSVISLAVVLFLVVPRTPEPADTGSVGTASGVDQRPPERSEIETDSGLMADDSVGADSASRQPGME